MFKVPFIIHIIRRGFYRFLTKEQRKNVCVPKIISIT